MGNYFDMDPTFWRVLFFVMFFLGFSGFLIYIILWIVMPGAVVQPGSSVMQDAEVVGEGVTPKKNGSMTAGLILIGIGAIGLLTRYVPQISWRTAWPIILIVIGIILLIPKKQKS